MTPQAKAKGESVSWRFITLLNNSSSYIFVDFRNSDDAELALSALHNHPFDAKHQFKVNRFTDVEAFAHLDESYVEPEQEEYAPKVRSLFHSFGRVINAFTQEHLRAWLADPQGRDQYVTYRGDDVEIHWHGKPSQSELAHKPVSFLI